MACVHGGVDVGGFDCLGHYTMVCRNYHKLDCTKYADYSIVQHGQQFPCKTMKEKDIYPLTIVADRYAGAYSGGLCLAFNLYPHEVPSAIFGGGTEAMEFWKDGGEHEKYIIGKAHRPDTAGYRLREKLQK